MIMGNLYEKLYAYASSDYYPYHMPGHKRRLAGKTIDSIKQLDITEIDGFDNLHDARDILFDIQKKAAGIYGAEESFFLVNGSTAGVLAAIAAATKEGGKLLMARNCHKSAYHGAYLRKLTIRYLWPPQNEQFGISKAITADEVEKALAEENDIQAVLIVSPTYEGYLADIKSIAEVVHRKGIPLIVDEAHGAHLGFHPAWAQNSTRLGADLVIQSLHKTLPSLTQTAILHVSGELIDRGVLRRFLQIYQTSSPSYLFMAAMEDAIDLVARNKEELFNCFLTLWKDMIDRLGECKCIHILQDCNLDIGKLIITDFSGNYSGKQLYEVLLNRYHLQMEMASGNYVLAMFTISDTKEGYDRLIHALLEIDKECQITGNNECTTKFWSITGHRPVSVSSLNKAWDASTKSVLLCDAIDCVVGDFINLYPPGIPYLVPGENLKKNDYLCLQEYIQNGFQVQGIQNHNGCLYVNVVEGIAEI